MRVGYYARVLGWRWVGVGMSWIEMRDREGNGFESKGIRAWMDEVGIYALRKRRDRGKC